jgi:hypothetical protein
VFFTTTCFVAHVFFTGYVSLYVSVSFISAVSDDYIIYHFHFQCPPLFHHTTQCFKRMTSHNHFNTAQGSIIQCWNICEHKHWHTNYSNFIFIFAALQIDSINLTFRLNFHWKIGLSQLGDSCGGVFESYPFLAPHHHH